MSNKIIAHNGHFALNRERYEAEREQEFLESQPGNPDNQRFYPGEKEAMLAKGDPDDLAYIKLVEAADLADDLEDKQH